MKEKTKSSKVQRAKSSTLIFVVQKHAATHLHYDFRLEVNGVLVSWAIPKGPSMNPADKRLAMKVEDHPYDWRDFEGTIPEGSYGAGTVMVWDSGDYYPVDEHGRRGDEYTMEEGLQQGKISFVLEGKKLSGLFAMVKLKHGAKGNEWLLIKGNDAAASTTDILKDDLSVLTHRSMKQIAKNGVE